MASLYLGRMSDIIQFLINSTRGDRLFLDILKRDVLVHFKMPPFGKLSE